MGVFFGGLREVFLLSSSPFFEFEPGEMGRKEKGGSLKGAIPQIVIRRRKKEEEGEEGESLVSSVL